LVAVTWTDPALDDLEAICVHIARDIPRAAEVFAHGAFLATDRLARFPRSGRLVPEARLEDIREIIFQRYRIIYRIHEPEIQILTVVHGARLLDVASLSESSDG
jgi:plasmid stabilization system protein ParE